MNFPAKPYFFIFGIITILGGLSGLIIKHSWISVVSGAIAGVLLIVGARLLNTAANMGGVALTLLVSLGLAGRFTPALFYGKLDPAVYIVPLSIVGVCVAALQLFKPEK